MCDQYGRRARFGHANDFGSKILYFLSNCQFKFVFFDPCIKPWYGCQLPGHDYNQACGGGKKLKQKHDNQTRNMDVKRARLSQAHNHVAEKTWQQLFPFANL